MPNILFVLYHDFSANSAVHVHNFANCLTRQGVDCAVAVPYNKSSVSVIGENLYQALEYSEILEEGKCFSDGRGPDIVHAWTPREVVRIFCEKLREQFDFKLFVHLEDNEELILEKFTQKSIAELIHAETDEIPVTLSHPIRYQQFLNQSDGVTVIIEQLKNFVPTGKSTLTLWPGVDTQTFYPRDRPTESLIELGIPLNSTVVCYTGNVHAANAHEVRSLYLGVAMLNREGYPTTLVRAGCDSYPFLGDSEIWGRKYSVELGYVEHNKIANVLALADVLIQPGRNDAFNDYRLPSKLPEFLAMGKPVILPDTNIGRFLDSMQNAVVLPKVDALSIVEIVKQLRCDRSLCSRLGEGASDFVKTYLDWSTNSQKLLNFYEQVLNYSLCTNA